MKKLITLVLALVICLSMFACGGPDRQPAIDAFNKASTAFDSVVNVMNENIEAYDQEIVDVMIEMSSLLTEHKALLEGEDELTQENLDEMIAWYGEVEAWVAEVKAELGI